MLLLIFTDSVFYKNRFSLTVGNGLKEKFHLQEVIILIWYLLRLHREVKDKGEPMHRNFSTKIFSLILSSKLSIIKLFWTINAKFVHVGGQIPETTKLL